MSPNQRLFKALKRKIISENSSVGRARPCQGRGRGFESRFSLEERIVDGFTESNPVSRSQERIVDGFTESNPVSRSKEQAMKFKTMNFLLFVLWVQVIHF